ncbi:MAG: tRNA (N(6)-L-threonylcarbamoyladenosine(37)-C(2))-methylthiotransferase [Candidatus Hodarchaeales archaeon]|jgi:MiaB-like tRNA modifying enzyme
MNNVEKKKKSVIVLNYGCSANRAIAEGLIGILQRNWYPLAQSIEEAELIIVNTCIVKQNTEHRMKSLLLSFSQNKDLIITGCLPVVMLDWINQNLPRAQILFPETANQIIDLLEKQPVKEDKATDPENWSSLYNEGRYYYNPVITAIEISRGCLSNCAYCIVKKVKGKIRSRSPESIITEITNANQKGSKEIWLTSQDTGYYGWDLTPKHFLPSLIDSITKIDGEFFVRVGMMTPNSLEKFKSSLITQLNKKKIFKFLHLPIQSGSDKILHAMKRREVINDFFDLIQLLREEVREIEIATDIIVGFPGETQNDFNATKRLISQIKPTIVNISRYTDRPGTSASKISPKISTRVKSSRSKELSEITHRISSVNMKKWIGWEGIALIDEKGKKSNQVIGRNTSYLPVVVNEGTLMQGQVVKTRIIDSGATYLIGEIM